MASSISAGTTSSTALVATADTSGALQLATNNGTVAVTIDTSQNMGVGTTSPDSSNKLQVAGDFGISWATDKFIGMKFGSGTSYKMGLMLKDSTRECKVWSQSSDSDDKITFYTGPTPSERARIDSSGNVGVGTSSPSTYANGYGPVLVAGASPNWATIQGRTDGPSGSTNGVAYGGSYSTNPINGARITFNAEGGSGQRGSISFWAKALDDNSTQPLERVRIINSGTMYLGYGGAAPLLSGSDVQGLSLTSNSNTLLQLYMIKAGQVEAHFGFKSGGDTNLYVGTAGGITGVGTYGLYQTNTSTTWTSVSDERFKTELQPIENALDKIANVRAVTGRYTYDEENGRTDRRSFLIAQDFVTALPEAVDHQDPDKLGLSYSDTIPLLYAAIKELTAKVNALEARLGASA